jgi:hypothetical protein
VKTLTKNKQSTGNPENQSNKITSRTLVNPEMAVGRQKQLFAHQKGQMIFSVHRSSLSLFPRERLRCTLPGEEWSRQEKDKQCQF